MPALRYFESRSGSDLLSEASIAIKQGLNAEIKLRKNYSAEFCRAALYLVEMRMHASEKFPKAQEMFFDRDGYEMATRAEVAAYRADRLSHCGEILDLCCGIGGDSMFLAQKAKVTAVDLSRTRIEMARINCSLIANAEIAFTVADANHFTVGKDAIFIDPARRKDGKRTHRSHLYSPPLSIAKKLRKISPNIIIKVSPAIPEEDLPCDTEIEFVSSGRQCREGIIYWGPIATTQRRATILPGPYTLTSDSKGDVGTDNPGKYIYDPDPAIVRAHLIDELGRNIEAWKLDQQVAYLTNNHLTKTPFARCYRLIETKPFGVKSLRKHLLQQSYFPKEIKRRRFPMEPSEIRQSLKVYGGSQPVVLICTRIGGKMNCLICENIGI